MKVSVIGGGSFGITLAQVLTDNSHDVLVYDINDKIKNQINNYHTHPFFEGLTFSDKIKITNNLEEIINYSDYYILALPTKFIRTFLKDIHNRINSKKVFINVSKGIEPVTTKRVSEIVSDEIKEELLKGYVVLSGPSHAEELVLRKATVLVSACVDHDLAKEIQLLFNNDSYLRVYTSCDVVGIELCGAIKNVIAVASGISTGIGLGENARAALISRGLLEILKITEVFGADRNTVFGLTGLGDLLVTASSLNSRNYRAGLKIGQGFDFKKVESDEVMTIEGIRTLEACYEIMIKNNLDLPIISSAYDIIYNNVDIDEVFSKLFIRELKKE